MGNQEIRSAMRPIQSKDFDVGALDPYLDKLWTATKVEELVSFRDLLNDSSNPDKMHLASGALNVEQSGIESDGKRNNASATQLLQAGFTTTEKKIESLKQGDYKQIVIASNKESENQERLMRLKAEILTGLFFSRNQGGSEVADGFFTFARKFMMKQDSSLMYDTTMQTTFMSTPESALQQIKSNPALLKATIQNMLLVAAPLEPGVHFNTDIKSFKDDLAHKNLRSMLLTAIECPASDAELRQLCVKLLLRIGLIRASGEDLMHAALLQSKYKIDLTEELEYFCKQSEVFKKPLGESSGAGFERENECTIQSRVSFDRGSDRAHEHDQLCTDGQKYFIWCDDRGMTRGSRKPKEGDWACEKQHDNTSYRNVTMFCHQQDFLVRMQDKEDQPFVIFSKETLEEDKEQEPYKMAENSEKSLLWTPLNTEMAENADQGNRWCRECPLFSDGELIYTLVQYKVRDFSSRVVKTMLEIYECENKVLTFREEIALYKNEAKEAFHGSRSKNNYLKRGSIACNGKTLVWFSNHRLHIFNLSTGIRADKQHLNSTALISTYDKKENWFHYMDAACYSWLKRFTLTNFKPRVLTKVVKELPDLPIVLDTLKSQALTRIKAAQEKKVKDEDEDEQTPMLNLFSQLAFDEKPIQCAPTQPEESKAEDVQGKHDDAFAIILSKMGIEAQKALFKLNARGEKQLVAEEMLPYFKTSYSVYCSQKYLIQLRQSLETAIDKMSEGKISVICQANTLNLIHLYLANFQSFIACRINFKEALPLEELKALKALQDKLDQIKLFDGQESKKDEDLSPEELFQVHLTRKADSLVQLIEVHLDIETIANKLICIEKSIKSGAESVQLGRFLSSLSTKTGMKSLFDGTKDELMQARQTIKLCLDEMMKTVQSNITSAITNKQFTAPAVSGHNKHILNFTSMFCQEMMFNFGVTLLNILENQDVKQDGDLSNEEKVKLETLKKAQARKILLEEVVYETFIVMSQTFKQMMNFITEQVRAARVYEWENEDQQKALFDYLSKMFHGQNSPSRICMMLSVMTFSHKPETIWLDEIAEALRNCAEGLDSYLLMKSNLLHKEKMALARVDKFQTTVDTALRGICHSIGAVANRLISVTKDDNDKGKNLRKLNILQGGVESRFIPSLKSETKAQIEGSFKITKDQQMRSLALKKESEVVVEAYDSLLMGIIDDAQSQPKVEKTLSLLQQGLKDKRPMVPFASLGGRFGFKLTRAAFSVLIKFTDGINAFVKLMEDIEFAFNDIQDKDQQEIQINKQIIKKFTESNNLEFSLMLKQYEKAAQMRKWTSQIKLTIDEKAKSEAEQAMRKQIDSENPSAEAHTGAFDDKQQKELNQKQAELFDKNLENSYREAIEKSKFLIKLAIPKSFIVLKSKEKVNTIKSALMSKLQNSALLLTQSQSAIGGISKQLSSSGIQRTNSLRTNEGDTSQFTIKTQDSLSRRKTILVKSSQLKEGEKEVDWRDRLRQWKQVGQSSGSVNSFADQQVEALNSSAFSVLGVLQTQITCEQLQDHVEQSLISGLRRSAGLHLLNFAMNLSYSENRFGDLVQWLQASLRNNMVQVCHYMTGMDSCGNRAETGIQQQFAQIMERILDVIKREEMRNQDTYVHLLDALCWDYTTEDHDLIDRLNIFDTLLKGNGELVHPLRCVWGCENSFYHLELDKQNKFNLAARLRQVFEFIACSVLDKIFVKRTQEKITLDDTSSHSSMVAREASVDNDVSLRVLSSLTQFLFGNIQRYLTIQKRNNSSEDEQEKLFKGGSSSEEPLSKTNLPQDIADYINQNGGPVKVLVDGKIEKHLNDIKISMLINKIDSKGTIDQNSDLAKMLRTVTRSTAQRETDLEEAISIVRKRSFRAVALIMKLSWEELSLEKPSLSLEDQVLIGGVSLEDIKKLRGIVEESGPEEEKKEEEAVVPEESKEPAPSTTVQIALAPSDREPLKDAAGHKMRFLWGPRDCGDSSVRVHPTGMSCDECREQIPYTNGDNGAFTCAWAECNHDFCRRCGVEKGGIELPKPPQTLKCTNHHFMYMRFGPFASNGGSGEQIRCDLCRTGITSDQISEGVFKCKSRACDYDVCKSCGLNNGGIEIPKPTTGPKCNRGHFMEMQYAPEPRCIRGGRGLGCDGCGASISDYDAGYFRCGGTCNYDICRQCGLNAGGIDPDLVQVVNLVEMKEKLTTEIQELQGKLAINEESSKSEQDMSKKGALMFESVSLNFALRKAQKELGRLGLASVEDEVVEGSAYSEISLTLIINMMERLVGLSQDSQQSQGVVKFFSNSQNFQLLVELAVTASIGTQIMVQKIIQQLMRLDLPQSTFDDAVTNAAQRNGGENSVAEILNTSSALQFKASPFLQFLFNCVQRARSCIYSQESKSIYGIEAILQEQLRTVRILFTVTDNNKSLTDIFVNCLSDSLQDFDRINSVAEIDSIMSFLPETALRSLTVGSPCVSFEGKLQIVLGMTDQDDNPAMSSRDIYPVLKDDGVVNVQVQSYDPANPQRQDMTLVPLYEPTPLLDLDLVDTQTAARASIMMQPAVLEVVFDLLDLKSGENDSQEQKLRLNTVQTFIVRGFFRMLDILKGEFLDKMSEFQWLDRLVKYLLQHADSEKKLMGHELLSAHIHETRLGLMRQSIMCSNKLFLDTSIVEKLPECRTGFQAGLQDEKKIQICAAALSEDDVPDQNFMFNVIQRFGTHETFLGTVNRQLNDSEGGKVSIGIRSANELKTLDKQTIKMIEQAKHLITEDSANLMEFFESLSKLGADDEKLLESILSTQIITISEKDFALLEQIHDSAIPLPKSSESNNLGFYFQKICKALKEESVVSVFEGAQVDLNDYFKLLLDTLQNENKDSAAVLETLKPLTNEFVQKIEDEEQRVMVLSAIEAKFTEILSESKADNDSANALSDADEKTKLNSTHPGEETKSEKPVKNWKECVHSTEKIGPTHGDTVEGGQNDLDQIKESIADDKLPQIKAIEIYHDDSLVFGFKIKYIGGKSATRHYGSHAHGNVKTDTHQLATGEYITGLNCRFGSICDQVSFTTSTGRTLTGGGSGGGPQTCEVPSDQKPYMIACITGMGGHVHNVKMQYIDLNEVPHLIAKIGEVDKKEVSAETQAIIDSPLKDTNFAKLVSLNETLNQQVKEEFWLSDSHGTKDESELRKMATVKYREATAEFKSDDVTNQYVDILKMLQSSTRRDMLMTILAEASDQLDPESLSMIRAESSFQKICDLVHNHYMIAQDVKQVYQRPLMHDMCKTQSLALLRFMKSDANFSKFFVENLMQRAKNFLVETITEDGMCSMRNVRSERKFDQQILDAHNLIFFGKVIFDEGFIAAEDKLRVANSLFDIMLGYALIYRSPEDYQLTHDLLKALMVNLTVIESHVEELSGNDSLMKQFFNSSLLSTLTANFDMSGSSLNARQKLVLELVMRIVKLQDNLQTQFSKDVSLGFELHDSLRAALKMSKVVEQGNKFTSFMGKLKFKALLASKDDCSKVSHLAKTYATAPQKYSISVQREIVATDNDLVLTVDKNTSKDLMKIVGEDGKAIYVDAMAMKAGKKIKLNIPKGQKAILEYPAYPQVLRYCGQMQLRNDNSLETKQEWTNLEASTEVAAVEVQAMHHAICLVGGDGSIWGLGFRAQGTDSDQEKLRKIQTPAGCSNFRKIIHGKFFRIIVTEDRSIWFSGQNRKYMVGSQVSRNDHQDAFWQLPENFFQMEEGDRIVDVAAGKHFVAVTSEQGKVYASGYIFYRNFSECRYNRQSDEDYPFQLKLPETGGPWKAQQVFGSEKYSNLWVTATNSDGQKKSFGAGGDADCIGHNLGDNSNKFYEIGVPEGIWFPQIVSQRTIVFGIDNEGNMWQWGQHFCDNSEQRVKLYGLEEIERRSKPVPIAWFKEKNIKCLEVKCGGEFAIVKTQDKDGKLEFYAIAKSDSQNYIGGGQGYEKLCDYVYKLSVQADSISSFACTRYATFFLFAKKAENASMDPENPSATGLMHFYQEDHPEKVIDGKKAKVWKFLSQDQYEAQKDSLPDLCFATRHKIKGLSEVVQKIKEGTASDSDWQYNGLPDLSNFNPSFTQPCVKYYAQLHCHGGDRTWVSEAEAMQAGQEYDQEPVIFIRSKNDLLSQTKMPEIDISALFSKDESEDSQIVYTVKNRDINLREVESIELSDPQQVELIDRIQAFTEEEDEQVLTQLDKQMMEKHSGANLSNLNINCFEITKDLFRKESTLQSVDLKAIEIRSGLLLKFNKQFSSMIKYVNVSQRHMAGSLANLHFKCKNMALKSVINTMVDKQLNDIDEGCKPEIDVNRRKAMVFEEEGNIDHEGRYSIYGQIIQALKEQGGSDLSHFRKKGADARIYKINFRGEGSMDWGGPFRDSLVNIVSEMESGLVPLLIKSPNNRNDHGSDRDCFVLDPASKSPNHLEMFKFLGAFIAFGILSKSPISLNLAPTVWKQILGQELTLSDLTQIDNYSAQVLTDLRQYSSSLTDEEFEATIDQNFTTVLSNGDEVVLCEGGEEKMVRKDNIEEFIALVVKARSSEAFEQNRAIQEGINIVFKGNLDVMAYLTPGAIEIRACGEKTISVERFKSITTYPNCANDHEIVGRFWRVFEAFQPEERALYLKFVWGRNRLPIDLTGVSKHELRLMTDMQETSFPQAHTCFFQLDIPYYRNDEICRSRLITASELCGGIDTDTNNIAED